MAAICQRHAVSVTLGRCRQIWLRLGWPGLDAGSFRRCSCLRHGALALAHGPHWAKGRLSRGGGIGVGVGVGGGGGGCGGGGGGGGGGLGVDLRVGVEAGVATVLPILPRRLPRRALIMVRVRARVRVWVWARVRARAQARVRVLVQDRGWVRVRVGFGSGLGFRLRSGSSPAPSSSPRVAAAAATPDDSGLGGGGSSSFRRGVAGAAGWSRQALSASACPLSAGTSQSSPVHIPGECNEQTN